MEQAAFIGQKGKKNNNLMYVSDVLVDIVEHSAAKEPDVCLRRWWSEYRTYRCHLAKSTTPTNVAQCQLDV